MGTFIIGAFIGLLTGMLLTGYVFVRRMLQLEQGDPFRSDDPVRDRELSRLRACVHRHIYLHIKHRTADADPPAISGADALRWLYLRDGVIFFEDGVATVPSGEQVNFGAVVARLIPTGEERARIGEHGVQESAQAAVAAELAASIVDRARRAQ
ncbi:hypothetical protein ACW9YQ_34515 (plasmid) [Paraburkholderia strydomiana]